jgi:hypothetical protein
MSENYQSVPLHDLSADEPLVQNGVSTDEVPKSTKWFLIVSLVLVIAGGVVLLTFLTNGDVTDSDCNEDTQNCLWKQALPERWTDIDQDLPALCTDLTAPGYYVKPAQDEESANNFVLYLGSLNPSCYSENTCWQSPESLSANPSEWVSYEGILDVDSPFSSWNLVAADPCSGDSFIGRMRWDDPDNDAGYHWAGYSLFYALLDGLLEDQGMVNITPYSLMPPHLFQLNFHKYAHSRNSRLICLMPVVNPLILVGRC